jgi:hypothetical protein
MNSTIEIPAYYSFDIILGVDQLVLPNYCIIEGYQTKSIYRQNKINRTDVTADVGIVSEVTNRMIQSGGVEKLTLHEKEIDYAEAKSRLSKLVESGIVQYATIKSYLVDGLYERLDRPSELELFGRKILENALDVIQPENTDRYRIEDEEFIHYEGDFIELDEDDDKDTWGNTQYDPDEDDDNEYDPNKNY